MANAGWEYIGNVSSNLARSQSWGGTLAKPCRHL